MKKTIKQNGFTIIELLIATVVLAFIVLMTTEIITGIGKLYYKAIAQSRLQDNVRSLTDEVSQKLKFGGKIGGSGFQTLSGSPVTLLGTNDMQAYCIGDTRYFFVTGIQVDAQNGGQLYHVLWRDHNPDPPNCDTYIDGSSTISLTDNMLDVKDSVNSGTELIGPRSRLVNFSLKQDSSSSVYSLDIKIAYGDDDLLCDTSVAATCSTTYTPPALGVVPNYVNLFTSKNLSCKGNVGDQYCAVSELNTSVLPLLN